MRICHINLSKGLRGGERQTALLIEALAQRGIEQCLVCRRQSPLRELLANTPNLTFAEAETPLANHKACRDYSLLHAHDGRAVHWCWLAHLRYRIPYIITRRVTNPLKDSWFTHKAYRGSSAVVALSSAIEQYLQSYDSTMQTFIIPDMCAHLPQDESQINAFKVKYSGKYIIGHAGALVEQKGQSTLIEAARLLAGKYPNMHFLLLGQGQDEPHLREQAASLHNIELVGFQHNVGDYLALMNLFAFPSLEEGLGSTLLDVMDYQVPIVASNVGGIPDLIEHGVNGLLVPPADAAALAAAIEKLYLDPELAAKMVKKGQELAASYAAEQIAQRYYQLYTEQLSETQEL